jgi:thiamine pyrophosphate-dependent acetolactate synthase large subunit-like protein
MAKSKSSRKMTTKFRKAASSRSGRVHVVPSKDGWSVKKEGSKRSSSVKSTKERAIRAARKLKSSDKIVIHKKDGTIQRSSKKR